MYTTGMNDRKLMVFVILQFLFWNAGLSQSSNIVIDSNRLRRQATEMAESFIKADFATVVNYTYPKVVEMMGGKNKMVGFLKENIEKMKIDGYVFKTLDVGLTSQFLNAGSEIHTIVLQRIVMTVPGGTLTTNSYLLGISGNGGKDWSFIDTAPLHEKSRLISLFPNYNQDLKIPQIEQPIFQEAR